MKIQIRNSYLVSYFISIIIKIKLYNSLLLIIYITLVSNSYSINKSKQSKRHFSASSSIHNINQDPNLNSDQNLDQDSDQVQPPMNYLYNSFDFGSQNTIDILLEQIRSKEVKIDKEVKEDKEVITNIHKENNLNTPKIINIRDMNVNEIYNKNPIDNIINKTSMAHNVATKNFYKKFNKPGMNIIEITNEIKKRNSLNSIYDEEYEINNNEKYKRNYKTILHEDLTYSKRNNEDFKTILTNNVRKENILTFSNYQSDFGKFALEQRKQSLQSLEICDINIKFAGKKFKHNSNYFNSDKKVYVGQLKLNQANQVNQANQADLCFKKYFDEDIGINILFQEHLEEMDHDDDQATDEEQLELATSHIQRELKIALSKFEKRIGNKNKRRVIFN